MFATPQPFQKRNTKHLGWALQVGHLIPNRKKQRALLWAEGKEHCSRERSPPPGDTLHSSGPWETPEEGGRIWIQEKMTNELRESSPDKTTRAPSPWLQYSQLPFILKGAGVQHRWPLLFTDDTTKCRALREEPHCSNSAGWGGRGASEEQVIILAHSFLTCKAGSSSPWVRLGYINTEPKTELLTPSEPIMKQNLIRENRKSPLKANNFPL